MDVKKTQSAKTDPGQAKSRKVRNEQSMIGTDNYMGNYSFTVYENADLAVGIGCKRSELTSEFRSDNAVGRDPALIKAF